VTHVGDAKVLGNVESEKLAETKDARVKVDTGGEVSDVDAEMVDEVAVGGKVGGLISAELRIRVSDVVVGSSGLNVRDSMAEDRSEELSSDNEGRKKANHCVSWLVVRCDQGAVWVCRLRFNV
jgi:hypothetical protein